MKQLNKKCRGCNCVGLVNQSITGVKFEESKQYYQCVADMESECLEGESMTIKSEVLENEK